MKRLISISLAGLLLAGVALAFLLRRDSDQEKARQNLRQLQIKGDTHDVYTGR